MKVSTIISTAAVLMMSGTLSALAQQTMPGCCIDQWNPSGMHRDHWAPEHMGPGQHQRMLRHWTFMNEGVPTAYRGARSTVAVTSDSVAEGRALFEANCESCHGATGMGDGDAGRSLSPSPALLSFMVRMPVAVDEYLLWSISDGGERFDTDMPAFRDALGEEDIWKIVAFMRAGFPSAATEQ